MVSASAKASSWSWVTSTVVMPSSRCTARMVRRSSSRILASSAPKGSSSKSTCGLSAHAQGEFDVVRDRHVAEQRIVLEYEADAAIARAHVSDVAAMQGDAAVVDAREPGDGPQQGALAAARRAQ